MMSRNKKTCLFNVLDYYYVEPIFTCGVVFGSNYKII